MKLTKVEKAVIKSLRAAKKMATPLPDWEPKTQAEFNDNEKLHTFDKLHDAALDYYNDLVKSVQNGTYSHDWNQNSKHFLYERLMCEMLGKHVFERSISPLIRSGSRGYLSKLGSASEEKIHDDALIAPQL